MSLLEACELTKSYGSTFALHGAVAERGRRRDRRRDGAVGLGQVDAAARRRRDRRGRMPASVRFDGRDVTRMSDGERSALRRSEFGFVFQFGQLVPELPCVENVALPLRLEGVRRREAERRALEWLARLEVDDVAGSRPGEVSGGQGQRVAVARALVTQPRVLFADEPTGALDSFNGERVMPLLVTAARERGTAVVLVTHEPRVAAYSDREVIVRDGKTRDLEPAAPMRDLLLGARLALSGGRTRLRADHGGRRRSAWRCCWSRRRCRTCSATGATATTRARDFALRARRGPLAIADAETTFRDEEIRGRLRARRRPGRAAPAGRRPAARAGRARRLAGAARLLRLRDGALLRPRLPGRVIGTIGHAGLQGPASSRSTAASATSRRRGATSTTSARRRRRPASTRRCCCSRPSRCRRAADAGRRVHRHRRALRRRGARPPAGGAAADRRRPRHDGADRGRRVAARRAAGRLLGALLFLAVRGRCRGRDARGTSASSRRTSRRRAARCCWSSSRCR